MDSVLVERLGGLAGFGGPGGRLTSTGRLDFAALSAADQQGLTALFAKPGAKSKPVADGFRYRITWQGKAVEVAEDRVPAVLRDCVVDRLK